MAFKHPTFDSLLFLTKIKIFFYCYIAVFADELIELSHYSLWVPSCWGDTKRPDPFAAEESVKPVLTAWGKRETKVTITDLTLSEIHKKTPSDFNMLQRTQGSVFFTWNFHENLSTKTNSTKSKHLILLLQCCS